MTILRENFDHTDEKMYIVLTQNSDRQLRKVFTNLSEEEKCYDQVKFDFEIKHMYFDNLVKSVNNIVPAIIQRLLPQPGDFLPKSSSSFQYKHKMHELVSQLDPDDQLNALKTIALCPARSPPILINGSFGSGKTRVLAIAANYITEMATEPARVLVCAHHQVSADTFTETYFGEMIMNRKHSWQVRFIRLTSSNYHVRSDKYSKFYINFYHLHKEVQSGGLSTHSGNLVIATTFLTALRLRDLFRPGFFTHILLDEGAQSREPEAIAPLSLASSGTKIIIAGDSCQVSNDLCHTVW